jgi:integrase
MQRALVTPGCLRSQFVSHVRFLNSTYRRRPVFHCVQTKQRIRRLITDVRTLQGLMGHEDIETTMIYAHLVESQKHEAARALSAFKKNCRKITTEEGGKVVAISA